MNNSWIVVLASLILVGILTQCTSEDSAQQSGTPPLEMSVAMPEWAASANIYEVNIRQYTPEGTFAAFIPHISRLKKMGVDILWLMPIFPISEERRKGTLGSYYAVSDFRTVNPEFGTLDDFKRLMETARQNQIRVILDWVPNHTGFGHRWITEHPEYYTQNDQGEIIDPINPETGESWGWTDVADLNYDNKSMRQQMISDMLYWVTDHRIDGFRCDVAEHVPDDFWVEAITQIRQINPNIFMLAEAEYGPHRNESLFAMSYGWSFHHLMNQVAKGEKPVSAFKEWLAADRAKFRKGYHMHFITNHDENSWNGTEYERLGPALKAMAVLTHTFDGMPLIYSGQESGLNRRLAFFEKDVITWDDLSLTEFYEKLLRLKHNNKAIWNGAFGGEPQIIETPQSEHVFMYLREKDKQQVVVALNLTTEPIDLIIDDPRIEGSYTNIFGNSSTTISTGTSIKLNGWDFMVLAR